MILSRSTRRLPAWRLTDILPDSDAAWRGVALVCLSLSTIVGMTVGAFGYLMSRFFYSQYRDGELPLTELALAGLAYGVCIAAPTLGWIFAARSRYRSAIASAVSPAVLYAAILVMALISR